MPRSIHMVQKGMEEHVNVNTGRYDWTSQLAKSRGFIYNGDAYVVDLEDWGDSFSFNTSTGEVVNAKIKAYVYGTMGYCSVGRIDKGHSWFKYDEPILSEEFLQREKAAGLGKYAQTTIRSETILQFDYFIKVLEC